MAKFLSFQQTAAALISQFGQRVTIRRDAPSTFDPVTQIETGGSVQEIAFTAVVMPPSQQARFTVGTLENRNAVECYFALKGQVTQPKPGDTLLANGDVFKVFWAQTYDPAGDGPIFTLAYAEN